MNLSPGKIIAFAYSSITRRLYLHTTIVALFLLLVISISIWTGNTLTMITAIARFERTHTVSRVEAMVALLKYLNYAEKGALELFQGKMAITQSYNKVFSTMIDMRKTKSDAEFIRILEDTFAETDHQTAVIIVNRMKVLYWHPIVKELVGYAVGANAAGERIKALVPRVLAVKNEKDRRALFAEIEKSEKDFIFYETSFSKSCSDLSTEVSTYVDYLSISLLLLSVGFTGLLSYMIAKTVFQQTADHTLSLEKEIQDKTEAENALKKSYELLSAIIESPKDIAIFALDENMRYMAFNADHKNRMKNIYNTDIAIGLCILDVMGDDRDQAEEAVLRALRGEHFTITQQYGRTEPKNSYEISYNPIFDKESGTVKGVTIFLVDISDKVRLETMLMQAQKMEAIGTLAGGIAHDFNNILGGIVGYAQLAEYEVPPESKTYGYIQHVLQASYRARDLVKQILSFSRQSDREKKPFRLDMIVKEVVKLLRASIPTTIDISVDIRNEPLVIIGDPTQIHQVIMNLCTNARQAMGDHPGKLTLLVERINSLLEVQRLALDLIEGAYVKLAVSDTGCGMSPNVMERIFDPYFTTKGKGEGTGLGLSVVHKIIKNHGGAIEVNSSPGEGASFRIFLPLHEITDTVTVSEEKKLLMGNERVLFVDDETILVEMGGEILRRLGYEAKVTNLPEEALEIFKAMPDRFDLLVTDMTMPKLTGELLAKEIHKIRPGLPVILCTGFSESITADRAQAVGIHAILLKPLIIENFAETIRRVLEAQNKITL